MGTFTFWEQEGILRRLAETLEFLHHQAVADQAFYRFEVDFGSNSYRIGVVRPEEEEFDDNIKSLAADAGSLSLELAAFISPSPGRSHTIIPPPSYPSLAEPVSLPEGMTFSDLKTMRGDFAASQGGTAYILFSPRGFSEFAVIHLQLVNGSPVTILINPFTGLTETYRDYKEFEWTYGRKEKR